MSGGATRAELEEARAAAAAIASAAGALLLEGWDTRPEVAFKGETDLVTVYDKRSEALIFERLRKAFPTDTVIGEEGATFLGPRGRQAGRVWYIDPLDGTTNFAHGLPIFSVSIGLCIDGEPVVGVVEAPALRYAFHGVAAPAPLATLNGKTIRPSAAEKLAHSLLVSGFPYVKTPEHDNQPAWAAMTAISQATRRLGSAALDLCFVACGWFDGYWEKHIRPWDLAAGAAIVRAAGGKVTAPEGGPFDCEAGHVLASNGLVHDEMAEILREVARTTALAAGPA